MPPPAASRRRAARAFTRWFRLFRPFRLVLVAVLVAFVRGVGGPRYVPEPAPRDLAAEVERELP